MSTATDALFARAQQLAQTASFVSGDDLKRLPAMSRAEVDGLPYGVVKVDDEGVVLLYNRYEASLANLEPSATEGRNFFLSVAPCTNNNLFYGSFRKGLAAGDFNVMFPYTFTYRMKPTNVKVHMYRDEASQTNWVLVQKA